MKRIIVTLITVFSMCCLVACGEDAKNDVTTGSNSEVVMNNGADEADATTESTVDPDSEVVETTEEPVVEPTSEPTEEPELYPGIDMESDLPGAEWIETFVGNIDTPKVVVYSDTTGRKEIVEEKSTVLINPDEDVLAVYIPEGYKFSGEVTGIKVAEFIASEHSESFLLDSEKTRKNKFEMAAIYVKHDDEKIMVVFTIQSE